MLVKIYFFRQDLNEESKNKETSEIKITDLKNVNFELIDLADVVEFVDENEGVILKSRSNNSNS